MRRCRPQKGGRGWASLTAHHPVHAGVSLPAASACTRAWGRRAWEVPLHGHVHQRHPCMGGTRTWEAPAHGRHPCMGGTHAWEAPAMEGSRV
eukprot:364782-Chlamydomonas_euryale.AAC.6